MKSSINHLPNQKQQELSQVVEVICASSDDIEMIVLFGSYARGDYKEKKDLKPDRWSGHLSDYDILAVTGRRVTAEDAMLSRQIADQCLVLGLSATVRLILHDIEQVNKRLVEGQYFFSDIKREGRRLYNSGKFQLSDEQGLTPSKQQQIAQNYYNHWYESARTFLKYSLHAIDNGDYKFAAFNLHQASEAAYKTILLVFTNYCPDEHFLHLLEQRAAKSHVLLPEVFPRQTQEERGRFEQLDLAYIGARYQPDWQITKEDLQWLAPRVRQLLDVTKTICRARIESQMVDEA